MRFLQSLTVGIVLRVVHAALVALRRLDSRVAAEFERMPEGLSYAIQTGYKGPTLYVQWDGKELRRLPELAAPTCALRIKSMPLSFRPSRLHHGGRGGGCHAPCSSGEPGGGVLVPENHDSAHHDGCAGNGGMLSACLRPHCAGLSDL